MIFVAWVVIIWIVMYTAGFAYKLWKERNKKGACAVIVLAVLIIFVQFLS